MIQLVLPFLVVALLLLLWAFVTSKLEYRFPKYFKWSQEMFDDLPKIAAVIVILIAVYLFLTQDSYYDW